MTKLIPPKAWVADLRKRKRPPESANLVGWVTEDELAEVQRNATQHALEAAAKAVCFGCNEEWPMSEREWTGYHVKDDRRLHCNALAIKVLIPKDPAPAGNKTKGGGNE